MRRRNVLLTRSVSNHSLASYRASREENLSEPTDTSTPPPANTHHDHLRLRLYTTGTYAVVPEGDGRLPRSFERGNFERTCHRLYNTVDKTLNWKPFLSGVYGRVLLPAILWCAVTFHQIIVISTRRHGTSIASRLLPALIAALTARSTSFIISQEFRRTSHRIGNRSISTRAHYLLQSYRFLVLFAIGPLMSLPVRRTHTPIVGHVDMVDFITLPSWHSVLENLDSAIPCEVRDGLITTVRNQLLPWVRSIDRRWEVSMNGSLRGVLSPIKFIGDTKPEDTTPWFEAAYGQGVLRPFHSAQSLRPDTLFAGWKTSTELLWYESECERLIVPSDLQITNVSGSSEVCFDAIDRDACGAAISLPAVQVDWKTSYFRNEAQDHQAWIEFLMERNKDTKNRYAHERIAICLERFQYWRSLMDVSEKAVRFIPQWVPASPLSSSPNVSCQGRHIFAASGDPFSPVNSTTFLNNIQAASCSVKFSKADVNMLATSAHAPSDFRKWPRPATQTYMEHFAEIGWATGLDTPAGRIPVYDQRLDADIVDRIEAILRDAIPGTEFTNFFYPYQLLRYQVEAASINDSTQYHAIAYGSRLFLSMLTQRLSTAAGLAFDETLSRGSFARPQQTSRYYKVPQQSWFWEEDILQQTLWFQFLYFTSVSAASVVVLLSHIFADDGPSGLPWDISSIAARAALLCRSSLVTVFKSGDHSPEDLEQLQPLKIGLWAENDDHNRHFWRADSTLNAPSLAPSRASHLNWKRHSIWSLPIHVNPLFVLLLMFCLLGGALLTWRISLSNARLANAPLTSPAKYDIFRFSKILYGADTGRRESFGVLFSCAVVPSFLAWVLAFWWWDEVSTFYQRRQPWAGLLRPTSSRINLTLDYVNSFLPLWKALKHRHIEIVILASGSLIHLFLPVLAVNFYNYEWSSQQVGRLSAPRSHTWSETPRPGNYGDKMQETLRDSLLAVSNSSQLPFWSSYREALLPTQHEVSRITDAPSDIRPDGIGYWEVNTTMVRSELACSEVHHDALKRGNRLEAIRLQLPPNYSTMNGSINLESNPCMSTNRSATHYTPSSNKGGNVLCSSFTLSYLLSAKENEPVPIWVITAIQGDTLPNHALQGPIFKHSIRSFTFICEPRTFMGSGTAQLLTTEDKLLPEAQVHRYVPNEELRLGRRIDNVFSDMLNGAVHVVNQTNDALRLEDSGIVTAGFTGDLLSFMLYQRAVLTDRTFDSRTYAEMISFVYSTVFAVAVQETGFLNEPLKEERNVDIIPLVWTEKFVVNKPVSIVLIAFTIGFGLSLPLLGLGPSRRKAYLFPTAPESLQNTWYFLYRSTILQSIQSIEHPERLSLGEFYSQVNELGLQCMFGRPSTHLPYTHARIDVASELENPPPEEEVPQEGNSRRYRDAPSDDEQSESEGSSSSSDHGDGHTPLNRGKRDDTNKSIDSATSASDAGIAATVDDPESLPEGEDSEQPYGDLYSAEDDDTPQTAQPRSSPISQEQIIPTRTPRRAIQETDFPRIDHLPELPARLGVTDERIYKLPSIPRELLDRLPSSSRVQSEVQARVSTSVKHQGSNSLPETSRTQPPSPSGPPTEDFRAVEDENTGPELDTAEVTSLDDTFDTRDLPDEEQIDLNAGDVPQRHEISPDPLASMYEDRNTLAVPDSSIQTSNCPPNIGSQAPDEQNSSIVEPAFGTTIQIPTDVSLNRGGSVGEQVGESSTSVVDTNVIEIDNGHAESASEEVHKNPDTPSNGDGHGEQI